MLRQQLILYVRSKRTINPSLNYYNRDPPSGEAETRVEPAIEVAQSQEQETKTEN